MSFFELSTPAEGAIPVLVEVPHAGLAVPDIVRDEVMTPWQSLMRDADIYVDTLYADASKLGATMLVSQVSRYVVDLNRSTEDIDSETVPDHPAPRPAQPRGVVWRTTTDGLPVLRKPLTYAQFLARLELFHVPYHGVLRMQLDRIRARFGYAILVAAHSMPSMGRAGHNDTGVRRADVVPGTQNRTTADDRVIDLVDAHFRDAGLSVRHDDPYRGGFTTQHYGRPKDRWHAIQIELNRALYVVEETGEPKQRELESLQRLLRELITKLGKLDLND